MLNRNKLRNLFGALMVIAAFIVAPTDSALAKTQTLPDGSVVISEDDIKLSPEEVQKKDQARLMNAALVTLVGLVLIAGLVRYFKKQRK